MSHHLHLGGKVQIWQDQNNLNLDTDFNDDTYNSRFVECMLKITMVFQVSSQYYQYYRGYYLVTKKETLQLPMMKVLPKCYLQFFEVTQNFPQFMLTLILKICNTSSIVCKKGELNIELNKYFAKICTVAISDNTALDLVSNCTAKQLS